MSAWLPDSYPTAPAPVTAVFAGLLTKVGVYAIIRTQTLLFPGGALDDLLLLAALATMIIGILGAVAQSDIRRMLSFTLVSHVGYMIFGIGLATVAGLAGAVFYVAHHIAIQTTLFLVAGLIERTGGSTSLDRLGGLARSSPLLGLLFFVPAMNLGGIPPLSGFIGKLGLLQAGVAAGGGLALTLVGASVTASLLTLLAVARVWTRAFWRPVIAPTGDGSWQRASGDGGSVASGLADGGGLTAWERHQAVATAARPQGNDAAGPARISERPLPRLMVAATSGMVAVTLLLTVVAGPLYGLAERAGADLLDRTPYIDAVLDGGSGG
jgi:multicomponent Na+:H+ antiporter subunit D